MFTQHDWVCCPRLLPQHSLSALHEMHRLRTHRGRPYPALSGHTLPCLTRERCHGERFKSTRGTPKAQRYSPCSQQLRHVVRGGGCMSWACLPQCSSTLEHRSLSDERLRARARREHVPSLGEVDGHLSGAEIAAALRQAVGSREAVLQRSHYRLHPLDWLLHPSQERASRARRRRRRIHATLRCGNGGTVTVAIPWRDPPARPRRPHAPWPVTSDVSAQAPSNREKAARHLMPLLARRTVGGWGLVDGLFEPPAEALELATIARRATRLLACYLGTRSAPLAY